MRSAAQQPARVLMSLDAGAKYLTVSVRTIRRRIEAGDLRAYKVPGTRVIRVDRNDLDQLLRPVGGDAA